MADILQKRWPVARLLVAVLLIILIVVAISLFARDNDRQDTEKPTLGVLTSMPIFWPEGDVSDSLAAGTDMSPVHYRLSQNFNLVPIDDWATVPRRKINLLILAQPRAFTPAELSGLDSWVRQGGRALILADPALHWESSYPLGDPRRPLFTSMLSPVLAHWGLELAIPIERQEERSEITVGGENIVTRAPGIWVQKKLDGSCAISNEGLLAKCDLGQGRAILLADADMLDPEYWNGAEGLFSDGDVADNMDWVEQVLLDLAK